MSHHTLTNSYRQPLLAYFLDQELNKKQLSIFLRKNKVREPNVLKLYHKPTDNDFFQIA